MVLGPGNHIVSPAVHSLVFNSLELMLECLSNAVPKSETGVPYRRLLGVGDEEELLEGGRVPVSAHHRASL